MRLVALTLLGSSAVAGCTSEELYNNLLVPIAMGAGAYGPAPVYAPYEPVSAPPNYDPEPALNAEYDPNYHYEQPYRPPPPDVPSPRSGGGPSDATNSG